MASYIKSQLFTINNHTQVRKNVNGPIKTIKCLHSNFATWNVNELRKAFNQRQLSSLTDDSCLSGLFSLTATAIYILQIQIGDTQYTK
jgi:hypothetical protein